jgi:tRNA G18 (ribose-2'-O)-methylase SpoU
MNVCHTGAKIAKLAKLVTPKRLERFDQVLNKRIGNVRLIFEDIANDGNCSACIRTAEGNGTNYISLDVY